MEIKPIDGRQVSKTTQKVEDKTVAKTYAIATSRISQVALTSSKPSGKRSFVKLSESDLPKMKVKI